MIPSTYLSRLRPSAQSYQQCKMIKQFVRAEHSFSHLQNILSKMKVSTEYEFPKEISRLGTSDLFNYATNKRYNKQHKAQALQSNKLNIWNRLLERDTKALQTRVPLNGFEEAILMTEEGRLWKYPIDNECGMYAEKQVPFEEHVFLERHLEDFPKSEYIQSFMGLIVAGLAKNPWMTVERKVAIIKYHKDYFESKRDMYKQAGLDMP